MRTTLTVSIDKGKSNVMNFFRLTFICINMIVTVGFTKNLVKLLMTVTHGGQKANSPYVLQYVNKYKMSLKKTAESA